MTEVTGCERFIRELAEANVCATPKFEPEVSIKLSVTSPVLAMYIEELHANMELAARMRGIELPLTRDELGRYVAMLIKTRVDYVNNRRPAFGPTDHICVPSFLSLVLENVGMVYQTDLGLELRPELVDEIEVDPEFMREKSRVIAMMGKHGLEYAKGYSRDKKGSFDFMTMCVIDNIVMSHSKLPHPVNAFLAAFLGNRGAESVLSPRITYGQMAHFTSLIRHVATLKG